MLAAILFMAGSSTSAATGVVYLAAFSLGLGTPFILVALFFNRFTTALGKLRKHMKAIRIGSGVFLVLVGLLIAFGRLQVLNAAVIRWGDAIQTWAAQRPDLSTGVFAAVLALIGLLPWLVAFLRGKGVRDAGSIPKTVILALGVGTALLEIAGSISIADGLHAWLSFQGL
jgi:cytochrome c-type biogenesis protein